MATEFLITTRFRPIKPQPPQPGTESNNVLVQTTSEQQQNQNLEKATLVSVSFPGTNALLPNEVTDEDRSTIHLEQVQIAGYFCNICNCFYNGSTHCPAHTDPVLVIPDSPIPPRSQLTLPKQLYIKTSDVLSGVNGVWSKNTIEKMTQFGPMIGKLIEKESVERIDVSDQPHVWKVFNDGKVTDGVCTLDENECNWMMHVQRARCSSEQNIVAFLHESKIFFMSTKSISPDNELLYWFSSDYCQLLGLPLKPEDGFGCTECSKKFLTAGALDRHRRYLHANTEGRRWQCTTCTKFFSSATKLSVHTLGHLGIKPHTCNYCKKQFTDASNLRSHLTIHTGERRFTCNTCGKTFRQKAHLNSHQLTHSGEKKLQCSYCARWFARNSDLRQHVLSHTKERQFVCNVCNKVFYRRQTLKKHAKMHTSTKEHPCPKCAKRFHTKYHMERHHKVCHYHDNDGQASAAAAAKENDVAQQVARLVASVTAMTQK